MSVYGMAVKLGIKGAAEAGKRGLVNNGVTKEFAEESSVAFEAINGAAAPALDGSSCQFRHIRLRLAFFPLAPGKIRHEPRLEPLKAGKTLF